MSDYRLHVFKIAAEVLNFTRAARELHISQPAVTQHIKQLEEHYGQALFVRGAAGLSLTPSGQLLHEHAVQCEAVEAELEARLRADAPLLSGTLKIAASTTIAQYLLPRWLGRFKQAHPQVRLDLRMGNTEEVGAALGARRVELGLVEGLYARRELKAQPFWEDEIVVVASPRHPLAQKRRLGLADLAAAPWVLREPGSGTRAVVERALKRARVNPKKLNVVLESWSSETIKGVVETGAGLAFLSRLALRHELTVGTLVVLPVAGFSIKRDLQLLRPQGPPAIGPVRHFADFLFEAAKADLTG
ncbi:hypothetical protein AXK11_08965 [Cephaloticoccus primus]|uniref:HTH lysR-type domain-containing protein n=1 Tax=Cephaloticoccus primus TaxID=1548207 RepID=A0A139SHK8_9BACT|nr:LysR substrate-binding domain-containing protein [Cephaloticoccus primus]KXU34055.1 hypothetical protein AXK11_08965 [Cephaloticoccus primus]